MKRSLLKMWKAGLLSALCLSAGISYGQALSGTATVGKSTSNYPNLTGANGLFQAINANGVNGTLTVLIDSSITEPCINGLNDFTSGGTANNYVRIQPAAAASMVVSSSASDSMIRLYNVSNLTINGSYDGAGRYLTFRNTNATKNSAVICFITGCIYDTLTNAIFEGSNSLTSPSTGSNPGIAGSGSNGGVIVLNAFNMAGNKDIAITGNIIKNIAGTPCSVLIRGLSNGGTPTFYDNDSLYIYKNHFVNANLTAIQLGTNNARPGPWIIDNNYFYYTESFSSTSGRTLVNLYEGTGHIFTNNIIGGSDSTGGGTPMTFNGTATLVCVSTGANTSTSAIQTRVLVNNNKIGNILINNSGGTGTYYGILAASKTEVNNNNIGGAGASNAINTNTYSFVGVNITGSDNYVHDNTIRNIVGSFQGSVATSRGVNGIGISAAASTVAYNVIDSIIGSTSANIMTNVPTAAPAGILALTQSSPGGTVIANNSITNIINTDNTSISGPGAIVVGIGIANTAYGMRVSGNYISNI